MAKSQTGTGTNRKLPLPHQRSPGANPLIGEPSPTTKVAPRQTVIPPRVTTKGGTFSRVIASPCNQPQINPTPVATTKATNQAQPPKAIGSSGTARESPVPLRTAAPLIAEKARIAPTDRSIPAGRITRVIPTAMTP